MALQNNPYLFTGGGERVNTRPHVALYAQLKQREQAKRDAFDEYFRNMNKNINPAGLRNQERAVFEEKLRNWQQDGINKKELLRNPRKDNGQASMEFQAGYQDLVNLINESKQKEEIKKPWVEIYSDPNKRDRINHDKAMESLSLHDQGLYKKNTTTGQWERNMDRRDFNITDIEFNPKPFEQDKFSQGLDDIKESQSSQTIKALPGFKEEVTTTTVFSPESKENIAYRSVAQFGKDKGFQKFIKELPQKERDKLKNLYETEFNEPATDDAHLAAGFGLKIKQQSSTKKEIRDDKFAQDKYLAGLRHGYAVALKKTPGAKPEGSEDDQTYIIDWWRDKTRRALSGPENLTNILKGGGYKLPMDAITGKAFARQGLEPKEIFVEEKNGEVIYTPQYFDLVPKTDANGKVQNGADGKPIMVEQRIDDLSQPMSEADALLNLGAKMVTGKPRTKEGQAAVRGTQPTPVKTYQGLDKNGNPIFK